MKKVTRLPFEFVLEKLSARDPIVRPMFGCHAIYIGQKIMVILRKKENAADDNGVWLATTREHHESLKTEFPSMRSIRLFGDSESSWQNLPDEATDFEESASKLCDLILRNDTRIGKVPQKKKKKNTGKLKPSKRK